MLPTSLSQNPSPLQDSQDRKQKVQALVTRILQTFRELLPSNYLSQVTGPNYTIQFQAIAEQLAEFQITAQEVFGDRANDTIRPEFMFQLLGSLVFSDENPVISGDTAYREFLTRTVVLLLQGATKEALDQGLALLSSDGTVFTIVENALAKRDQNVVSKPDQYTFEVNVSNESRFLPIDPFLLEINVRLVLSALKPAHMLYSYRHLLRDAFGQLFADQISSTLSFRYYEDARKWCCGANRINGTAGETLAVRNLFRDVTRDFGQVQPYAKLTVTSGPNENTFTVKRVVDFYGGDDTQARSYVTTPTGLSGMATVEGDVIEDLDQNFGLCSEGEVLQFTEGPNTGTYRLKTLLGNNGGPVGLVSGATATRVKIASSTIELYERMSSVTSGQTYWVSIHRLGIQVPQDVVLEDVSSQFFA